ncbi:MAG: hypothetical protein M9910_12725 [Kiritimatiellae bacterium]|nr:hypothetical protein [Kiritimatiellia bacterium]
MKGPHVKVTYSLDESTVMAIRDMSATWGVAQSEVVRRCVKGVSEGASQGSVGSRTRLEALRKSSHSAHQDSCAGHAGKQERGALQEWVRSLYGGKVPAGVVDDLIAERRREAAKE